MTQEDQTDLEKREAHLNYIIEISHLYTNLKRRKSAPAALKEQITSLEMHLATELQEFLNNG